MTGLVPAPVGATEGSSDGDHAIVEGVGRDLCRQRSGDVVFERSYAVDGYADDIAGRQGEVVARNDAGSGE